MARPPQGDGSRSGLAASLRRLLLLYRSYSQEGSMLSTFVTIWILHVAAMVSPGPNVLLVSQLAASDRARSAVFAALGVTSGAAVWATCAVLGVNIVFVAFP